MKQAEARGIAIRATRSQVRSQKIDPATLSGNEAVEVLDDIARVEPDLVASKWYLNASDNQVKLFVREWNIWRRECGIGF